MNITKEEYEMAKDLPEDSPKLLSTYNNFALSKVTTEYALKIDADQVYFTEHLKQWCDFLRDCEPQKMTFRVILGKMFSIYISAYRFLSMKSGKVLPLLPLWLAKVGSPYYISYAKYAFSHNKSCLALSGVNVLEQNGETLISMGHGMNDFKALSPFNGCGDTVIFNMSCSPRFEKKIIPEYNPPHTKMYSVVESFVLPLKVMYIGYFWKHLSIMRPIVVKQALCLHYADNEAYLSIDEFKKLSYKEIVKQSSGSIFPLFQRILFGFVYKANKHQLFSDLEKH